MNLEEQIRLHKEISQKIEELEQQKRALSVSIMRQMTDKTLRLGNYLVRKCTRLSIKLTIEEAKALGATKLEEMIDKEKIKALYQKSKTIPGVTEIEYIQVSMDGQLNDRKS